jgi:hypothetical protein
VRFSELAIFTLEHQYYDSGEFRGRLSYCANDAVEEGLRSLCPSPFEVCGKKDGLNSVDVYLLINAGFGPRRDERFPYTNEKRSRSRWFIDGGQAVK